MFILLFKLVGIDKCALIFKVKDLFYYIFTMESKDDNEDSRKKLQELEEARQQQQKQELQQQQSQNETGDSRDGPAKGGSSGQSKSGCSVSSRTPAISIPNADDRLKYPSKDGTYFSQLYNQPLVTTLSSFSHVANLVRNPYELINNVDEFVRHASGNGRKYQRTSENFARTLNQHRHSSTPNSPVVQEMDTFVAHDKSSESSSILAANMTGQSLPHSGSRDELGGRRATTDQAAGQSQPHQLPIPALPPIECSNKRGRLEPLTIEEYERDFRQTATDLDLIERVFYGSFSNNQIRAALWPYLFGLIIHRGKFEKRIDAATGREAWIFIEHEANNPRWRELRQMYEMYQSQWQAIVPDQETRFSAFRERKSLIERDVIRCDRLHLFYAEEPQNLSKLTCLLMTYMMHDFDIGYVQGMSDLAGPILYMYQGDVVKSFWIFVEVMKLFRRNFELTQKTIHFQLSCLYELTKNTDPIFAQYLEENESSNCFFAFRAIVCQFKRELMKDDEDDYTNVLFLWDTIWACKRRCELEEELKILTGDEMQVEGKEMSNDDGKMDQEVEEKPVTTQPSTQNDSPFAIPLDPNQADSPRYKLTETEIFVLALCLSMIRRERDLILANRLDSTDIHLHFIDPKLATDLNGFIEHAINIYSFMKKDFDITKLTSPKSHMTSTEVRGGGGEPSETNAESPPDGYDLLSDFLIINGAGF